MSVGAGERFAFSASMQVPKVDFSKRENREEMHKRGGDADSESDGEDVDSKTEKGKEADLSDSKGGDDVPDIFQKKK